MDELQRESECIRELHDGTVVVDRGPMLMSISVSSGGVPNVSLSRQGARRALEVLGLLAGFRHLITQKVDRAATGDSLPPVVGKMLSVARRFDDPTITPLIAVAGAGADEVADFITGRQHVGKVVVNNGGDIAVRIKNQEIVKIGIKTDVSEKAISHVMTVGTKSGIGGVATSGFGGRSFTMGVANAAVAVARDAISADVAATLIGNAANVKSRAVSRDMAKNLYHATDIPNHLVTTGIGGLTKSEIDEAINAGRRKAETFQNMGLIIGAIVAVKDRTWISESILPMTQQVSDLKAV